MSGRWKMCLWATAASLLAAALPAAAQNQHEMTFHTVPSCTVVDTRVTGGAFAANETRTYNVAGAINLTSQGGSSTIGCLIPGWSNNIAQVQAVELTITAVSPGGAGYIAANAADATMVGSVFTLSSGLSVTNTLPVAIAQTIGSGDFKVNVAFTTSHVVVRVIGYYSKPVQTVWVHPVPGDAAASGQALLDALTGITNASSTKHYVVKVEPGIYDVGNSQVVMKQYVDIEGSGQLATILQGQGSNDTALTVVTLASNSELRNLAVTNTAGTGQTIAGAIYGSGTVNNFVTNVTMSASGGSSTNFGIRLNSANPTISDVTISATGGSLTEGIVVRSTATPLIRRARITVTNTTGSGYGIISGNSGIPAEIDDVHVEVTGGPSLVGFEQPMATGSSTLRVSNSTFLVSGASSLSYGIEMPSDNLLLSHTIARASGGATSAGVRAASLHADNCEIAGDVNTVISLSSASIGGTKLDGGPVSGTATCAGVWDENYTFSASTCP